MSKTVGRPKSKLEVNLNHPLDALDDVMKLCENELVKDKVNNFANCIKQITTKTDTVSTQTKCDVESVLETALGLDSFDKCFLMSSLWSEIKSEDQVKTLFLLYNDLSFHQQCDMFSFLGNSLNEAVYKNSLKKSKSGLDINIEDLKIAGKMEFYDECDVRIKNFIDNLTSKKRSNNENMNYKANVWENILKARNSKFLSETGVKEHMINYLASGKSRHATQVFSKQGGKGTRPLLENILKNSEDICKFEAPEHVTLLFSFDNIQTLLKSHRIGGEHQKKILAIVVCSIMCLMPDGKMKSQIQYACENTPANWYSKYKYDSNKSMFVEELDASSLKNCLNMKEEELDIFNEVFEKDLKDALDFVEKDMGVDQQDTIDLISKARIAKKRKLCDSGHINDNVKSNRRVCDRSFCKANLQEQIHTEVPNVPISQKDNLDKPKEKANLYLNVPNVANDNIPKEEAVGAIAVNPNTAERIAKVLDEIIDAADMKNKYSVKIVLSADTVTKVLNTNPEFRKFVMVTADGLPYKIIIDLIKNEHKCAECGKRIEYLAYMTEHMNETKHSEFFQTYGNILPNIGHFHYALTMLRSLVKLQWNIDYQELVKAIHFETPKSLFMQEKVTDFRKSLDTYRTVRAARLRELVTPYVKYSMENNLTVSVESFLLWKKFFVQSKTYEAIFQIEKFYGTSFLLFHASLRANNFKYVNIAKKVFSPLFHINRHPIYSIMDIHTDYLEETLAKNAPDLEKYLNVRRCSNFSGHPYASEPHDERHEEFNKRGLNMQKVRTAEDFKQSFQLVDHYIQMKNSCFKEYDIKIHGGNVITIPDYEENISKMRVSMRKNSFLTKPERNTELLSLAENKPLNPALPKLVEIAKKQRQDNVLNVIRHKAFNFGYDTKGIFKVLKNEVEEKLAINYEMQLRILIASEEDPEVRENLNQYWETSKSHPEYDDEKIVDDILCKKFSFI